MKTPICISCFLLFSVNLFGPSFLFAQDYKAEMILADAYRKFKAYNNLKMNFTSVTEHKERNLYQVTRGTAYIQGVKHVVEYPDRKIITDGNTIWTYRRKQKAIYVSTYNPNDGRITPDEIFREDFLSQGLSYRYINSESATNAVSSGRPEDIIELNPKENRRNYIKFRVYVDRQTHQINHWKVYLKNGSTIDYSINITPNVSLSDSFFSYNRRNFPSDVKVVDLR